MYKVATQRDKGLRAHMGALDASTPALTMVYTALLMYPSPAGLWVGSVVVSLVLVGAALAAGAVVSGRGLASIVPVPRQKLKYLDVQRDGYK